MAISLHFNSSSFLPNSKNISTKCLKSFENPRDVDLLDFLTPEVCHKCVKRFFSGSHSVPRPLFFMCRQKNLMIPAKQREQFQAIWRRNKNEPERWIDRNRKRGCPDSEELVSSFPLSTPFRDYSLAALWLHYLLWDGALEDHNTLTESGVCVQKCVKSANMHEVYVCVCWLGVSDSFLGSVSVYM